MTLEPAALDGRVEPRELLGAGGMGEVHAAWDRALERAVAVKFVRGSGPADAERLLLEARLQARVDHPHVVKVFEVGTLRGRPCIVFQLVRGRALDASPSALPLAERVELVRQAASGLHAAHLQGLVHRDVKPGNILVEEGEDGARTARVTDFGLAHAEEGGLTRSGLVPGTLDFMAPEQLAGSAPVDFRADVYALGATLYAVLAGRSPFRFPSAPGESGEMQLRVLRRILDEDPPALRTVAPEVPRELALVAAKAMEKDPAARYPTAEAFAEDLARFQRGEPVRARQATLGERALKWARRNRAASRAIAAAAVVLLAAGGFALWLSRQAGLEALEAARLVAVATSLESRMRMEHLSPPHDLRRALAAVKAEVERLAPLAARRGGGAASFALGKGLELGGDLDGARAAYARAWELGFRTPQVAEGLGTVLGRVYEREHEKAREALTPEARARRLAELGRELRDPARGYLERADATGWRGPFLRAQIALLEGDFPAARARAAEALAAEPGRYEARVLEGEAWFREGKELLDFQKGEAARATMDRAVAPLEAAAEAGRSDPAPRALLAEIHSYAALSLQRQSKDPSPRADLAASWAERAAALDPDSASLALSRGRIVEARALFAEEAGRSGSLELFERAAASFRRAAQLAPRWYKPRCKIAYNAYCRVSVLLDQEKPARAELAEALEAIEQAASLAPQDDEVLYLSVLVRATEGLVLRREGRDPTEALGRAVESGEALVRLDGIPLSQPRIVLSDAHLDLALAGWSRSRDPRASLDRAVRLVEDSYAEKKEQAEGALKLLDALQPAVDLRAAVGEDVGPLLSRGLAVARQAAAAFPDVPKLRIHLAELLLQDARRRAGRGEDPAAPLAELEAALEGAGERAAAGARLAWKEVVAAGWEAERGRSPAPLLARAERAFERLLRAGSLVQEAHAGLATCALVRARWHAGRAEPAAEAARRGLAELEKRAAAGGADPRDWVLRARLENLAGEREAARASLERAYAMQPLVRGGREAREAEAELRR